MDLEAYNPEPQKYYRYKAKDLLSQNPEESFLNYRDIQMCAYTINTDALYPFQQFLLISDENTNTLSFPQLSTFKSLDFDVGDFISYSKVMLFGLLELNNFEDFANDAVFDGFYESDNNLYLFFDITKINLQIYDIYSNSVLRLALIDEILNHKKICNIEILCEVTRLFERDNELCFLLDADDYIYEIPIVCFVGKEGQRLSFTYTFGESPRDCSALFGPHYYFTDFTCAARRLKKYNANYNKNGLVRFALFQGNTKYIENLPNDPVDDSETKKLRLEDETLDKNREYLTIRISDHDGNWSKNFNSVYLGDLELENGAHLEEAPLFVVKDYNQQLPLSFHYINEVSTSTDVFRYEIV